jgi:DNA-binding NarL/FixJ family response regulator
VHRVPPPVRVVVAEDQALLREGIVRLLTDGGVDVLAAVGDADALRAAARDLDPDLVVVDVQMPPDHTDDGLRAAIELRAAAPGLRVLVLSQHVEERYVLDLVGTDASGVGYLLKDRVADVATLLDAVERVAAGGSVLDPLVVASMVGRARREDSPLQRLTPREREVLALMAEGKSNPGIAAGLGISAAAAEKHAGNVFRKLGVGEAPDEHRRVMAVLTHLRAS